MNWAKELQKAVQSIGKPDVVPKHYFCSEMLAKSGMKKPTVTRYIKKLRTAGRVERKVFRVAVKDGRIIPRPFYRLVP